MPEGDAERGRETFASLNCTACHTVAGVEFESPGGAPQERIRLGGETSYVRTYGDLVTSIINPSHRFAYGYRDEAVKTDEGESKMRFYNDEMTVTQLTNLVAFLQQHYTLRRYEPTPYMPYP